MIILIFWIFFGKILSVFIYVCGVVINNIKDEVEMICIMCIEYYVR